MHVMMRFAKALRILREKSTVGILLQKMGYLPYRQLRYHEKRVVLATAVSIRFKVYRQSVYN